MIHTLAYKNLFRRKTRTFLSILGITIGIAMIVALVSISEGLKVTTNKLAGNMGTNMWVSEKSGAGSLGMLSSNLDISRLEKVESMPGIEAVAPEIWAMADLKGYDGGHMGLGQLGVAVLGLEPESAKKVGAIYATKISSGRMFRQGEQNVVVLGKKLAVGTGAKAGDKVTLLHSNEEYKFTVTGIYETGQDEADDVFVIPLKEARSINDMPTSKISVIEAKPTNPDMVDTISRRLKLSIGDIDVTYPRQLVEQFAGFIDTIKLVTYVITGIAALIGGIGVANTMIMSVLEQTKEIGVLKAVGWYSSDVLKMVIFESMMISSVGALAGISLGSSVAIFVLPAVFKGMLTLVVTPNLLLNSLMFALIIGVGGGIYPAMKAAKLDPVVAFGGR